MLQFGDEGRVPNLLRIAFDDERQDVFDVGHFGEDQRLDAGAAPGGFQRLQGLGRNRAAVIERARALPAHDGRTEHGRCRRRSRTQGDGHRIGRRVEPSLGGKAEERRRLNHVLGSAAEARIEVMVVRIDHRAAPAEIRCDGDGAVTDGEPTEAAWPSAHRVRSALP